MPTFPTSGRIVAAALSLTVLVVPTACSKDAPAQESPTELLAKAKTTLDTTSSVHFKLTSTDVPSGGTRLIGGEGVAARPPAFQGTLDVFISGAKVSVDVVSVGGKVYAKLPFQAGYGVADPKTLGLKDPATLIDTETGLSRLVAETFTSSDPGKPVETVAFVVKDSGELRRAVLKGPFFEPSKNSTFTLVLDQYGAKVAISAPPVS